MNQEASQAELEHVRLRQAFDDVPVGRGCCPMKSPEVAIFPVRYAIDASPEKGQAQGPHPLPKGWAPKLQPTLKTRSYTLRQLRDGWLYVWDSVDKTFHEYQVIGRMFTRHTWTALEIGQDLRTNPGESRPYLLYPRRSILRLAFSPVQWTWRLCEAMRSGGLQTPWLRDLDLPDYCDTYQVAHGAPLVQLGQSVADIRVQDQPAPNLLSTTLPTDADPSDPDRPFKRDFEEALIRGYVPDQHTALFIALDDPLALVDDLSLNLTGRRLEQALFEQENQEKLQTATAVQALCGFDCTPLLPAHVAQDPALTRAYTDDLYTLLKADDEAERARVVGSAGDAPMIETWRWEVEKLEAKFIQRWGKLPHPGTWRRTLAEWRDKRLWREDVHFDELQGFLSRATAQAAQLEAHAQRSERDLLNWLERLAPNADTLFFDTCNPAHSRTLLETAEGLATLLGGGEAGQDWLCRQAVKPSTLLGTALFNFNPEIAALVRTVAHNFATTGLLDGRSQGDGSTRPVDPDNPADVTSVATRANELKGVLDLPSVKKSKAYQALSTTARQAFDTLVTVANSSAEGAWHTLSMTLAPALQRAYASATDVLTQVVTQALISTQASDATQLRFNPDFKAQFRRWQQQVLGLQRQIDAQQRTLTRPGAPHDQAATRTALRSLTLQLQDLHFSRPHQLVFTLSLVNRLNVHVDLLHQQLGDLGQQEALAQHRLKSQQRERFNARSREWMGKHFGQSLPLMLVGLNVWNTLYSLEQASADGLFNNSELRMMTANAAYTGNAMMAVCVGPAWNRAQGLSAPLGNEITKLTKAGARAWLAQGDINFAQAAKRLIARTATWAALGAIAAGVEAWQVSKDIAGASSEDEKDALEWKRLSLLGMAGVASFQLAGAIAGYWFNFAWIMSSPVTIVLGALGIAYLLFSVHANRYKREGLRLWLYRCSWGKAPEDTWVGIDGHKTQLMALLEILQRPSVWARAVYTYPDRGPQRCLGFWVQLLLPATLAGSIVQLQPVVIDSEGSPVYHTPQQQSPLYEHFLRGHWVDPELAGQLPEAAGGQQLQSDFAYQAKDQYRIWQAWVATPTSNAALELEVHYPPPLNQRADARGYMFRVALRDALREAERKNTLFSDMLPEEQKLEKHSLYGLNLQVPEGMAK